MFWFKEREMSFSFHFANYDVVTGYCKCKIILVIFGCLVLDVAKSSCVSYILC